jgi:hypothetical protein
VGFLEVLRATLRFLELRFAREASREAFALSACGAFTMSSRVTVSPRGLAGIILAAADMALKAIVAVKFG